MTPLDREEIPCYNGEMMEKVVHCKKHPYDVYIGRPSKWGNPYSHKDNTLAEFKVASVEEAVERYEEYLRGNKYLMSCLHELDGKVLGCWCTTGPCHGHVLRKVLKEEGFS